MLPALIKQNYKLVGIDNYIKILLDKEFIAAFLTSIEWTVFSLLGQIGVGFTAALALNRIKKGHRLFRTALIIPWAFPSIVIAHAWKWILSGIYRFFANLLVQIGICQSTHQFLSNESLVFGTLVMINIWFPFYILRYHISASWWGSWWCCVRYGFSIILTRYFYLQAAVLLIC